MKAIGVIPARFHSTRFPGKPLAKIAGKMMVQRVFEAASRARELEEVFVATDSMEIAQACRMIGAPCLSTTEKPRTGTERVAEAVRKMDADIVLNIQGDEPLIRPETLDALVRKLEEGPAPMATVATRRADLVAFRDRDKVKVVMDRDGMALYFSRAGIPFGGEKNFLLHVGIYGFRQPALIDFVAAGQSRLEVFEDLEQLRALEMGMRIAVVMAGYPLVSVDRPEDIARAGLFIEKKGAWKGL
jgi:3-deoxy-manno-octulosonate cytidylyltransferase (CMP-KDO synthetase)